VSFPTNSFIFNNRGLSKHLLNNTSWPLVTPQTFSTYLPLHYHYLIHYHCHCMNYSLWRCQLAKLVQLAFGCTIISPLTYLLTYLQLPESLSLLWPPSSLFISDLALWVVASNCEAGTEFASNNVKKCYRQ